MANGAVMQRANAGRGVLSELMRVGLVILDEDDRPVFHNRLALELMGCDSDEELAAGWERLRSRGGLRGSSAPAFDAVENHHDGSKLQVEVVPMREGGMTGAVVMLMDGGADVALSHELLLASRMRAQNYIFNALLHDLRAPLNAMEINLELLTDTCHEMRTDYDAGQSAVPRRQSDQIVAVLKEELARLNRSLRMVLEQGGSTMPRAEDFDLAMMIRELAVLLRPQARAQRAQIELALPPGAVLVQGQRDEVKQALLNVAINGLEAMAEGGRLTVMLTADANLARVVFCDTGPGIPEEMLEQVCRIYFTTKASGTGMGLFVARLVIEAQGGTVQVANQAAGGACITMTLPRSGTSGRSPN